VLQNGEVIEAGNPRKVYNDPQYLYTARLLANCNVLSAAEAAVIATDANGVAERNLRSTAESGRLLKSFSKAGLETLFLKGLTLSVLAYGDPFAKEGSDIDLLVDADAVKEAAALLEELGYRPSVPEGASRGAIARWHVRAVAGRSRASSGARVSTVARATDARATAAASPTAAPAARAVAVQSGQRAG